MELQELFSKFEIYGFNEDEVISALIEYYDMQEIECQEFGCL